MVIKFCPKCGKEVFFCGMSEWSSGVWLYGCPNCETLYEHHKCSLTGKDSHWKISSRMFSEWRALQK